MVKQASDNNKRVSAQDDIRFRLERMKVLFSEIQEIRKNVAIMRENDELEPSLGQASIDREHIGTYVA